MRFFSDFPGIAVKNGWAKHARNAPLFRAAKRVRVRPVSDRGLVLGDVEGRMTLRLPV